LDAAVIRVGRANSRRSRHEPVSERIERVAGGLKSEAAEKLQCAALDKCLKIGAFKMNDDENAKMNG
jgi:hypothetical protein